jgi:hypothetical protein
MSKFIRYPTIFLEKKNKKNYKDLSVGKDLTEFIKILISESLNKIDILEILTRINIKS